MLVVCIVAIIAYRLQVGLPGLPLQAATLGQVAATAETAADAPGLQSLLAQADALHRALQEGDDLSSPPHVEVTGEAVELGGALGRWEVVKQRGLRLEANLQDLNQHQAALGALAAEEVQARHDHRDAVQQYKRAQSAGQLMQAALQRGRDQQAALEKELADALADLDAFNGENFGATAAALEAEHAALAARVDQLDKRHAAHVADLAAKVQAEDGCRVEYEQRMAQVSQAEDRLDSLQFQAVKHKSEQAALHSTLRDLADALARKKALLVRYETALRAQEEEAALHQRFNAILQAKGAELLEAKKSLDNLGEGADQPLGHTEALAAEGEGEELADLLRAERLHKEHQDALRHTRDRLQGLEQFVHTLQGESNAPGNDDRSRDMLRQLAGQKAALEAAVQDLARASREAEAQSGQLLAVLRDADEELARLRAVVALRGAWMQQFQQCRNTAQLQVVPAQRSLQLLEQEREEGKVALLRLRGQLDEHARLSFSKREVEGEKRRRIANLQRQMAAHGLSFQQSLASELEQAAGFFEAKRALDASRSRLAELLRAIAHTQGLIAGAREQLRSSGAALLALLNAVESEQRSQPV